MAQKSSGKHQGSRHKLSKEPGRKVTVNEFMKEFEVGEKALIKYNASVQEGRQHHRFHGDTAEVVGFRGDAVKLEVEDGNKTKTLFLKPVHLKKIEA